MVKRIYKFIRSIYRNWNKRLSLKRIIKSTDNNLNIVIGAGQTSFNGWISTDYPVFDITSEKHWKFLFKKSSIDKMLAEHVLEHLTEKQVAKVFSFSYQYLKRDGVFRFAVPDGYNSNAEYINAIRPGGWDIGADDHKVLWNQELFTEIASKNGFNVQLLEYYDMFGVFHSMPFEIADGYIFRCKNNNYIDKNVPNYSSLVIDLIKR